MRESRQKNSGYRHALHVARSLLGAARILKVVEFAGAKDLSEWVEKEHTKEERSVLIRNAKVLDAIDGLERRWFQTNRFRIDNSGVHYQDPESDPEALLICGRLSDREVFGDYISDHYGIWC